MKKTFEALRNFRKEHNITVRDVAHPVRLLKLLSTTGYLTFFAVGASGVLILLFVTWILTKFYFGIENYFTAYLIGLSANLVYNFILHTIQTFKTKKKHAKRFFIFITYSFLMAFVQALLIRSLTDFVGKEFYLLIIAVVVGVLSTVTFIFFKITLFKD